MSRSPKRTHISGRAKLNSQTLVVINDSNLLINGKPNVNAEIHSECLMDSTATRQAGDEAACPTETVFFAFRLKAPGCFFSGCASED
jgi:hypothetical protein